MTVGYRCDLCKFRLDLKGYAVVLYAQLMEPMETLKNLKEGEILYLHLCEGCWIQMTDPLPPLRKIEWCTNCHELEAGSVDSLCDECRLLWLDARLSQEDE